MDFATLTHLLLPHQKGIATVWRSDDAVRQPRETSRWPLCSHPPPLSCRTCPANAARLRRTAGASHTPAQLAADRPLVRGDGALAGRPDAQGRDAVAGGCLCAGA